MFATARRSNGYAGLHDLATSTRVIAKNTREDRTRSVQPSSDDRPPSSPQRLGPYLVLPETSPCGEHVLVGYDDRLRRRVWLRRSEGTAPVGPDRRTLSRSTRLRWLSGRRAADEAWDAFEAADGQPLLTMIGRAQSWSAVRLWLLDLAGELRAGLADGSLAPLALEHVWITAAGRAKLLDWPAVPGSSAHAGNLGGAQRFLHEVAVRTLTAGSSDGSRGPRVPLPIDARRFIDRLRAGSFDRADAVLDEISSLVREPAAVTRGRRIGHLVFCGLPPALAAAILTALFWVVTSVLAGDPRQNELTELVSRLEDLIDPPADRRRHDEVRAYQIFIAAKHRATVEDPATWSSMWSLLRINRELRPLAEEAIAAYPNPTEAEIRSAEPIVQGHLGRRKAALESMRSPPGVAQMLLLIGVAASLYEAALGLLSAWAFRGGLGLRLFGADVVTAEGERAGRMRTLLRALVAWSPAALAAVAIEIAPNPFTAGTAWLLAAGACVTLFAVGTAYAIRHPDCGLQDRVAGTRLVPR
jgi:hypothetical protein